MQRFHQIVFVVLVLALSWLAMMAVHEFGHVIGAAVTGGSVRQVVLHPLAISRTDVSPNPNPLLVVWSGPVFGCLLPFLAVVIVPARLVVVRKLALFFAGFCLIANGAYVGIGSFDRIGDCRVMLNHGSPLWTLLLFGVTAISSGAYVWHRLGSVGRFLSDPAGVRPMAAYTLMVALVLFFAIELLLS